MVYPISRLYDFVDGTRARSAQVDAEFNQLVSAINELTGTGGANKLGVDTITGISGTTVQSIMEGLKALVDLCYTSSTVDTLLSAKETVANANQLVKSITFNSLDGKFTITKQDGTTSVIDTALEKVAINFSYDQDTQSLILTLADGSTTTIPLSALIQENDFVDSDTVDFSVTNHTVTAVIKNASITEAMLTSATLTALVGYKIAAETAATNAAASESNALTYKNSAGVSASDALASKNAAKVSETNSKTSETNSKTSETNSKASENSAATSAAQALDYKNQAAAIVGDKVSSFNGRKDAVVAADADYLDSQIAFCEATRTSLELLEDARLSDVLINMAESIDAIAENEYTHDQNMSIHVTSDEKTEWNGKAERVSGTATLATANWVGSSAPYSYALTVTGLLATDVPHINCVTGANATTAANIKTAWGLILANPVEPQISADTITFYAQTKPIVNIPIIYEVVR